MSRPLLVTQRLHKSFQLGAQRLEILKGIDLSVYEGEAVCIVGASGAGKSTLLHILGTLDRPTSGKVLFNGKDLFLKSAEDLAKFRNKSIGFVFQFHHLLKEFTALENVMIPCRIGGVSAKAALLKAEKLLGEVGMSHRLKHTPSELSGGEQQRVAVARALAQDPDVLLADEPTGNLDSANSEKVQQMFFGLKEQRKLTLIVVTHDKNFSRRFPRVIGLKDGLVQ